jgi:subtilisin family serine protease
VIVQLGVTTFPEGEIESAEAVASQRQKIAATRAALLAELAGTSHRTIREFETIPFVALEVAPDAMSALESSPNVVGVEEDRLLSPLLSQSVPLIGADQAWAAGFDGTGVVVAILDTGVDKTHPFLSGKVVEEACFSSNGNCPNGLTLQTGPGAGVPCTYAPNGCRHGTYVAGIAAGSGAGAGVSFSGVAKGTHIIAVQVFSRLTGGACAGAGEDPCALVFSSDVIMGGERVLTLSSQYAIAAVNVSLGVPVDSPLRATPAPSSRPGRL